MSLELTSIWTDTEEFPLDLVVISPLGRNYLGDTFKKHTPDDEFEKDEDDNRYSGLESNPELMEIDNPAAGIWIVGTTQEKGNENRYKLESNQRIRKLIEGESVDVLFQIVQNAVAVAEANPTYKNIRNVWDVMDAFDSTEDTKYDSEIGVLAERNVELEEDFNQAAGALQEVLKENTVENSDGGVKIGGTFYKIYPDDVTDVPVGELFVYETPFFNFWDIFLPATELSEKVVDLDPKKGVFMSEDVSTATLQDAAADLSKAFEDIRAAVQTGKGTKE